MSLSLTAKEVAARARPQFLVVRVCLLATEMEAPDEEAVFLLHVYFNANQFYFDMKVFAQRLALIQRYIQGLFQRDLFVQLVIPYQKWSISTESSSGEYKSRCVENCHQPLHYQRG